MVQRYYNKLTEEKLDSSRLAVVIGGVGNDESLKSGEKEVFFGGSNRRDDRCISESSVVGR